MPQLLAAAPPAAPPAAPAATPAPMDSGENTPKEQSFTTTLQAKLGAPAHATAAPTAKSPSAAEPVAGDPPATDGKDLPPDLAALIAASQPPAVAAASDTATTTENAASDAGPAKPVDLPVPAAPPTTAPVDATVAAIQAGVTPVRDAPAVVAEPSPAGVDRDARRTRGAVPLISAGTRATDSKTTGDGNKAVPEVDLAVSAGKVPPSHVAATAPPDATVSKDSQVSADARTLALAASAVPPRDPGNTRTDVSAPAPSIPVPFGQAGWDQAVAQRVSWMVSQHSQSAQLHMNPPQLGPLEVRITIKDDQASVSFISAHGQVREALQAAIPHLRDMLGDSGLNLAHVDVGQHSHAGARERPGNSGGQTQHPQNEADASSTQPRREDAVALGGGLSLIDYYA
jgi:flagellar hook-length control protein FliK